MEIRSVEWTRGDVTLQIPFRWVYLLQNGRPRTEVVNPLYRGRTSLFFEKLQQGNISLKISSLRLSDQGTYLCEAVRDGMAVRHGTIQLRLGKI